jgi:hypothetical protein
MALSSASCLPRELHTVASGCESRSPATIARMIRRPGVFMPSLRACENEMCICHNAFCMWRTWGE